jgi:AraC-like DNA-binding protein
MPASRSRAYPGRDLEGVGVRALTPLIEELAKQGHSVADLLRDFGLDARTVEDEDCRIPIALLDTLWQRASAVSGDHFFGLHAAEGVSRGSFGLLSYLGSVQPSLGEGLHSVIRYFRLLSDASEYRLELGGATVRLTAWQYVVTEAPVRQRVEFTIAAMFRYCKAAVVGDFCIEEVFFEHPAPPDTGEHRRIFGLEPRFLAGESGFRFAAAWLECPLHTSDRHLAALLQRLADWTLMETNSRQTTGRLLQKLILQESLRTPLTLATAAHRLGMSPRGLQRRLNRERTTLRRLTDELREAVAAQLLQETEQGLAEVASALGFSDLAAFCRAFKRWKGVTPAGFRRSRPAACAR